MGAEHDELRHQQAGRPRAELVAVRDLRPGQGGSGVAHRVISDCHFRKTATEYDRKPGINWLSCTAKWRSDSCDPSRAPRRRITTPEVKFDPAECEKRMPGLIKARLPPAPFTVGIYPIVTLENIYMY